MTLTTAHAWLAFLIKTLAWGQIRFTFIIQIVFRDPYSQIEMVWVKQDYLSLALQLNFKSSLLIIIKS